MVLPMVVRATATLSRPTRLLQRRSLLAVRPLSSPSPLVALPRRAFTSSSSSQDGADDAPSQLLVYEGPMARAVRLMKGVSVTSCALTTVGMPVLCFMNEQSASVIGKWAMCGTIMLFGLGTTTLYHVLFQPYVLRMWVDADAPLRDDTVVTAETLTLLAQRATHEFQLGDVTRPGSNSMHPMLSFSAKGKHYFIHPEVIQDDALVKKLMGEDFQVVRKEADTKDKDEEDSYY